MLLMKFTINPNSLRARHFSIRSKQQQSSKDSQLWGKSILPLLQFQSIHLQLLQGLCRIRRTFIRTSLPITQLEPHLTLYCQRLLIRPNSLVEVPAFRKMTWSLGLTHFPPHSRCTQPRRKLWLTTKTIKRTLSVFEATSLWCHLPTSSSSSSLGGCTTEAATS